MSLIFKLKQCCSSVIDKLGICDRIISTHKKKYIFGYHRILPKKKAEEYMTQSCMWTSPENFEKHLLWMRKIGEIVSLDTIVSNHERVTKPTFAITFDDGWKDNYEYAYPILKKYNIPATIFLATKVIDSGITFWPEEMCIKVKSVINLSGVSAVVIALKKVLSTTQVKLPKSNNFQTLLEIFIEYLKIIDKDSRFIKIKEFYDLLHIDYMPVIGHILSWQEIIEMNHNKISFGSHTHSHLILRGEKPNVIFEELVTSKKTIEKKLGQECYWFCYPNARFNEDDDILLQNVGYKYGMTLMKNPLRNSDSNYFLPRYLVYDEITNPLGYFKFCLMKVPFF